MSQMQSPAPRLHRWRGEGGGGLSAHAGDIKKAWPRAMLAWRIHQGYGVLLAVQAAVAADAAAGSVCLLRC